MDSVPCGRHRLPASCYQGPGSCRAASPQVLGLLCPLVASGPRLGYGPVTDRQGCPFPAVSLCLDHTFANGLSSQLLEASI